MSTLSAILKEEPKPPEAVPADLEKIIRRCLRKYPARRFQQTATGPAPRKGVHGRPTRIGGLDVGVGSFAVSAYMTDQNIWTFDGAAKTQLIASTRRDFDPQFSPDGSKIAFVSDRTGGWEIYVSDAQGGHRDWPRDRVRRGAAGRQPRRGTAEAVAGLESVSQGDGRRFLWNQTDHRDADLVLVENFR